MECFANFHFKECMFASLSCYQAFHPFLCFNLQFPQYLLIHCDSLFSWFCLAVSCLLHPFVPCLSDCRRRGTTESIPARTPPIINTYTRMTSQMSAAVSSRGWNRPPCSFVGGYLRRIDKAGLRSRAWTALEPVCD